MARRPQSVTTAQVIIYIISVLAALAAVAMIGLGVAGIMSGATMAGSAAETDAFAGAFGGVLGLFAGAVLVQGLVTAAFVALWLWAASALGRASRAAQIVVTVLCSINVALGLGLVVVAGSMRELGLPFAMFVGVPGLIIILLWGPADSREFFAGRRPIQVQQGPWGQHPGPSSPPVGFVVPPRSAPEPITTPLRLGPVCGRCGAVGAPGGAFCGGCGSPVSTVRHARA